MFGPQANSNADVHRSIFMSSVNWLAMILAIIIAMIGAPFAYNVTTPYLLILISENYGPELITIVDFVWWILLYPLVFFAGKATVGVLFLILGSHAAHRFIR